MKLWPLLSKQLISERRKVDRCEVCHQHLQAVSGKSTQGWLVIS